MNIVVLGGGGLMGRASVYDLALSRPVRRILVADYDLKAARDVAHKFGAGKAKARFADARDRRSLTRLLRGYDLVINATQHHMNLEVMEAALAAQANYIDLGGLFHMTRQQLKLRPAFRRAGLLAILGMGGAPGITNVMARYAANQLARVYSIRIYNAGTDLTRTSHPLPFTFSIQTILDECTLPPVTFRAGRFVEVENFSGAERLTFPAPVGLVTVHHSLHSEVATLPLAFRHKGLRECFFKINYDEDFVRKVRFLERLGLLGREPVKVGGCKVIPREIFLELLRRLHSPGKAVNDAEVLRVEVDGRSGLRRRSVTLEMSVRARARLGLSAVAQDTGMPPSIVAQMVLNGTLQERGVRAPEDCVPPEPFFKELARRGMPVFSQVREPLSGTPDRTPGGGDGG